MFIDFHKAYVVDPSAFIPESLPSSPGAQL
jgi:hypothetical protein